MYQEKSIAVVVPAYNEERLITKTLNNIPEFVDQIVVIDDGSRDQTAAIVKAYQNNHVRRLTLLQHEENAGVGAAIASGYKWCRDNQVDVAVVMAGDAQMDPDDLPAILEPVVSDRVDYSKGNRLFTGDAWRKIPRTRYLGNSAMSLLTKISSGYWHVADSQCGYTAINSEALRRVNWDQMYRRYGQPNDILVRLNVYGFRVCDVPVKPIYGIGEDSGIRPLLLIPKLSWLLLTLFLWRMKEKYIIRDFHPLVFFYALAVLLLFAAVVLSGRLAYRWAVFGSIPPINALAVMFAGISGLQSLFFAMWFDMNYNKDLR
jgi:glycosyltransferase involved in cell wall biosynthesis